MTLLVADIGGTNARFAVAQCAEPKGLTLTHTETLRVADFESFEAALRHYLKGVDAAPLKAAIAVAAPVRGDWVAFTNNSWAFSQIQVKADFGFEEVIVVNDFEALAAGIVHLPGRYLTLVRSGQANPKAPQLVIGPGTGLGQALVVPSGDTPSIIPTQGGHVSFAPRSEMEIKILNILSREHSHVSAELLLSGMGLENIYRALCQIKGDTHQRLRAAEISEAALGGEHPTAAQAAGLFCNILGAVVGDAVLSAGALGGVTLAGGIVPKIMDVFLASDFEFHFLSKGPMRQYLEPVPIQLITQDGAALYGAAALSSR